jgi:hypothetical protein
LIGIVGRLVYYFAMKGAIDREPLPVEEMRTPQIAQRIGEFVTGIEAATPETPISIDTMGLRGPSVLTDLQDQLAQTDKFYDRHTELFASAQYRHGFELPDFATVLDLTQAVVSYASEIYPLRNGADLALAITRIAEAGSRLADDPMVVKDAHRQGRVSAMTNSLTDRLQTTYKSVFADRIRGDLTAIPLPRIGYLGHLVDTHLRFWTQPDVQNGLSADLRKRVGQVFLRLPSKHFAYDNHSLLGSPDRQTARGAYLQRIETYEQSLETTSHLSCAHLQPNLFDGFRLVFNTLDATRQKNYTPEAGLQLVVKNSARIGRITETTTHLFGGEKANKATYEIDDNGTLTLTPADIPAYDKYLLTEDEKLKLERRDAVAGICPARHFIRLSHAGKTYSGLQHLSAAIQERIGVKPPILYETTDAVYVDPAAMIIDFTLLAVADNRGRLL